MPNYLSVFIYALITCFNLFLVVNFCVVYFLLIDLPLAIWKFYFKLMNNKLPNCFFSYKPVIPVVNERYEIRNPGFHFYVINHKFAEQSL